MIKEIVQHHLMNIVTFFTLEPPTKTDSTQSNEETHESRMLMLESMLSTSVYNCVLGQCESYATIKMKSC